MVAIALVHLAATSAMAGIIWFVQVVHYPLFGRVGNDAFCDYESAHRRLTTIVVGPTMVLELATGAILLWNALSVSGARSLETTVAGAGMALIALVWATTFF